VAEPAVVALCPPERSIVGFATALRSAGLAVPVGAVLSYARALDKVGLDRQDRVYWAGRSTLVMRPEDAGLYDEIFRRFWLGGEALLCLHATPRPLTLAVDDGAEGDGDGCAEDLLHDLTLRWSAAEVLAHKDFATYTPTEWAELQRLLARLRISAAVRRARRRRPERHRRSHPDLRQTLRRAMRTGGEPIDRAWRAPADRARRLVLLVDVSGSMEPYARAFLRFAHAALMVRGPNRAEAFTLGTRLTRVSQELALSDPDAGLRAAAEVVTDWSGGTRLGADLQEFNDRWGCRGLARGAIVVVASDGWDRGCPEHLAEQMGRLARVAYRVVWANPLKATAGYAPLARGMAAALPYVDDFVEGHSLASLEKLAAVLCGSPSRQKRSSA